MTGLLATKPRPADVPALAEAALWQELELTPKPGLVDKLNNGSHRDMDHALFVRSIAAITPWFSRFAELGSAHADKPLANSCALSARWAWPASRRCMPRRTE
jgi:triphosphoribosyl-dephospho-CoA synthase